MHNYFNLTNAYLVKSQIMSHAVVTFSGLSCPNFGFRKSYKKIKQTLGLFKRVCSGNTDCYSSFKSFQTFTFH